MPGVSCNVSVRKPRFFQVTRHCVPFSTQATAGTETQEVTISLASSMTPPVVFCQIRYYFNAHDANESHCLNIQ